MLDLFSLKLLSLVRSEKIPFKSILAFVFLGGATTLSYSDESEAAMAVPSLKVKFFFTLFSSAIYYITERN